jgi:SAM-dependent methyltransferase
MKRLARWSDTSATGQRLRRLAVSNRLTGGVLRTADRARMRLLEREGEPAARSKRRWRDASPDPALTWGSELSGEAAAVAAERCGAFGPGRTVLEVGPGYGRILRSALELDLPFERYIGLDISDRNVSHLREALQDPRVEFLQGDAESARLPAAPDALISFLTFKHLYPTFEGALANLVPQLAPGGVVVFDLLEGDRAYFHRDATTFIRHYDRDEVREILAMVGLVDIGLGPLTHAPGRERLLVNARRAAADG